MTKSLSEKEEELNVIEKRLQEKETEQREKEEMVINLQDQLNQVKLLPYCAIFQILVKCLRTVVRVSDIYFILVT